MKGVALGLIGYMAIFVLNIAVLHYVENGIYLALGLIVANYVAIYYLLTKTKKITFLVSLFVIIMISAYWVAEDLGRGINSNVNFSNIPVYSVFVMLVGFLIAVYFLAKDKASLDYKQKLEKTEFNNMENFFASASGVKTKALQDDKMNFMLNEEKRKGRLDLANRRSGEAEYDFESNKEKGNFFEGLIQNYYTMNGYEILTDLALDSLYKVDVVAYNTSSVEFIQCKFWNPEAGYKLKKEDAEDILKKHIMAIDYFEKKIGLNGRELSLKIFVSDYDFIDYGGFVEVFEDFRCRYPMYNFEFREVDWDRENYSLMIS